MNERISSITNSIKTEKLNMNKADAEKRFVKNPDHISLIRQK
jgi:hypothetical protein